MLHRIPARFVLSLALAVLALPVARADDAQPEAIRAEKIRQHVEFLSQDELAGRDSGEPGLEVAAEYLANQFRSYGLEPAGDNGTYFQHFTVPFGAMFGREAGAIILAKGPPGAGPGIQLQEGSDVVAFGHGGEASVDAPMAFVGYGVTTGEEERKAGLVYDDYAGIDVKNKVVMLLRYVPIGKNDPFGGKRSPQAALAAKLRNARDHGAAGAVIIPWPHLGETSADDDLEGLAHRAAPRAATLPALLVSRTVADRLLGRSGKDVESLRQKIDESLSPQSFDLPDLRIQFHTIPGRFALRNIAARWPGGPGEQGRETIVVGAHYDHIGRFGNQVAPKNLGQIHNGADDNASGTAGILELARVASKTGRSPGRAVLFLCFSGEEIGLLGSRAWLDAARRFKVLKDTPHYESATGAESGTLGAGMILMSLGPSSNDRLEVVSELSGSRTWVPTSAVEQLDGPEAPYRVAAMINLDMVGRAKPGARITVLGAGSSQDFARSIESLSKSTGLQFEANDRGLAGGGSDSDSFIAKGIPALFFFTGMHPQYNTPEDDAATINFEGERALLEAVRALVSSLASAPERPRFDPKALARSQGGHGRPRLGVQLDTEFTGGARIESTLKDSLAEKAGIRAGDVILAVGDTVVRGASDLATIIEGLPADEEFTIRVRRADKVELLKLMFPSRKGGFRVSFGSVPDYAFAGKGVRFEGIREGSPAAKAGVQSGDVLVQWNSQAVEDVEQWTSLLGKSKPGDEVEVELQRGDARVRLKVKLEARD